jgi:hypothetical protein
MGTARRKRTWTGVGSVRVVCIRFPLQGVHRFELPRLSDMSNHLSCGSHHIDNLMELMIIYVGIINFALL